MEVFYKGLRGQLEEISEQKQKDEAAKLPTWLST